MKFLGLLIPKIARAFDGIFVLEPTNILARPERFELPTTWFEARYSIQLSYGRVFKINDLGVGGEGRVAKF